MITDLILRKQTGSVPQRIGAGALLYLLNWLLCLDFLLATALGFDPRLSVSAGLGIRLHRRPTSLLGKLLPGAFKQHCLQSAAWWGYAYPAVNRSIWT